MSKDIPDWAFERVAELRGAEGGHRFSVSHLRDMNWANAFARYIMEHEEEPVDLFEEAVHQSLMSAMPITFASKHDRAGDVLLIIEEMRKRGIELGKGGDA